MACRRPGHKPEPLVTNALMCVLAQYPVTMFTRHLPAKMAITLGMLVYALGVGSVALMTGFWGFWLSMVIMSLGELILVLTGSNMWGNIAPEEARTVYERVLADRAWHALRRQWWAAICMTALRRKRSGGAGC